MNRLNAMENRYVENIRRSNNQVGKRTIKSFLVNAWSFLNRMVTGYRVAVISNNVVKIILGNKADGKEYQQHKGEKFLYGRFFPQRIP
jgi:hypothetical protein